jgi:hypothetical protein
MTEEINKNKHRNLTTRPYRSSNILLYTVHIQIVKTKQKEGRENVTAVDYVVQVFEINPACTYPFISVVLHLHFPNC